MLGPLARAGSVDVETAENTREPDAPSQAAKTFGGSLPPENLERQIFGSYRLLSAWRD